VKFSIIIPIHNEELYLKTFLFDLLNKLKGFKDYEVVLVENGSTDQTRTLAKQICLKKKQVRLLTLPHGNYGLAVKNGFLSAKGDYLVLFDLDYYDISFLEKGLSLMKDYHAIVGSKLGQGAKDSRSWNRRLGTRFFSFLLKFFFGMKISDTHGIKVINRKEFMAIIKKCQFTQDIFDTELLIRGEYEDKKVGEVGVLVKEKRVSRSSLLKRVPRTLNNLLKLKIVLGHEYSNL
jgi:glycosyltransferase involved in cell wall biosynthesis